MRVRVRQSAGQLRFDSEPAARRARHAHVPRWHFDMVQVLPFQVSLQTPAATVEALLPVAAACHPLVPYVLTCM